MHRHQGRSTTTVQVPVESGLAVDMEGDNLVLDPAYPTSRRHVGAFSRIPTEREQPIKPLNVALAVDRPRSPIRRDTRPIAPTTEPDPQQLLLLLEGLDI